VTTQLTTAQAATRFLRTRAFQLLCCAALCATSLSAFAQDSTAGAPAAIAGGSTLVASSANALPSNNVPSTHVRPVFGDLAEANGLDTAVVLQAPNKSPGLTDRIQGVLSKAMTLLGTPYRWGGESEQGGFDCSGLVGYVYRSVLGMDLPRVSRQMAQSGEQVDRTALVPGDLVFFGLRGRVNHVGIYVGEGRFLHAPSRGKVVRVDNLANAYWAGRFMQGRRVAM
jgi:cell wall-associated NlpC family hydrolase